MKTSGWSSYKRTRVILLLLVIGWIPFGLSVIWLQTRVDFPALVSWTLIAVWVLFVLIQGTRLAIWPCPNCGKFFRGPLPFLPKQCWYCKHPR